jgi:hypothetical protein
MTALATGSLERLTASSNRCSLSPDGRPATQNWRRARAARRYRQATVPGGRAVAAGCRRLGSAAGPTWAPAGYHRCHQRRVGPAGPWPRRGASAAGSWAAAVGLPDLGMVAAAEVGIVLERFPLVPALPPHRWTAVVGALLEAMDIVLVGPPSHLPAGQARRLAALARERGAVLVTIGAGWPHPVDLRLGTVERRWLGLGWGHGTCGPAGRGLPRSDGTQQRERRRSGCGFPTKPAASRRAMGQTAASWPPGQP